MKQCYAAFSTVFQLLPISSTIFTYNCKRYQCSLSAPIENSAMAACNGQICVALMVSAPINVAKILSTYLRDPENKTGAFGWVKSCKRQIMKKKYDTKTKKMTLAPPGECNTNYLNPLR